jgi:hypothetical protein
MASFNNNIFTEYDDWMTPKSAWEDIKKYIPNDKKIWEAFYGNGTSGQYLKELGFDIIHEPIDFFKNDKGDIIVSNPPYSRDLLPNILERLHNLDKPFILILPCSKICTKYFQKLEKFKNNIQIIIPKGRIKFKKLVDGKIDETKKSPSFDCFYYCWKIKLDNDITFL